MEPPPRWAVPAWLDRLAAWGWRLGVVGAIFYVAFRLFWALRLVTVPVVVALILTALLWPLRRALTGRRVPETLAAGALLLGIGTVLVAVIWLTSLGIGRQLSDDERWEETVTEVEDWLVEGPVGLEREDLDGYRSRLGDWVATGLIDEGVSRAAQVAQIAGAVLLSTVLLFFFLRDGPGMWRFVQRRVRPERQVVLADAGEAAFRALGGYATGITVTGLIDGAAVGIVLVVLGVPLALPLAILTFFAAYLPIVGATVVGALSAVVALVTVGPREAVILVVATLVIQQIEGDLVLPLVMGRRVALHPAVVLAVLALGGALAGVIGALVSVPLLAMGWAAIRAAVSSEPIDGSEPLDGSDRRRRGTPVTSESHPTEEQ